MSEKEKERKLEMDVPESCPVCGKKKKNILLHIKAREECYQNVDRQKFDKWKEISRKKTKSKYQKKYVESGDHSKAQDKYLEIKKTIKQEWYQKKLLKEKQKVKAMFKKKEFMKISASSFIYIIKGRIPPPCFLSHRHFSLGKEDDEEFSLLSEEESEAWLKEIDTVFLDAVISLQILVLIPNSVWLSAIQTLEQNEEKQLKDKLLKLIGKLQAGNNENTREISIPKEYQSNSLDAFPEWDLKEAFRDNILSRVEEKMFISLVNNIFEDNAGLLVDRDLQKLLGVSEDMNNLTHALTCTNVKYD